MTNCPNCGAPYALNSRVCEYCGTVCEPAQEQHDNINFNLGNGNVIVNSAIGVNNKVARHSGYGIDGKYEALKQSLDVRYNALKGRAAFDSKQADKLTEAEAFVKLAAIVCIATALSVVTKALFMLIW